MKGFISYSISTILSISIFSFFCLKFSCGKKLWNILNKRINPNYSGAIWILIVILIQTIITLICDDIGLNHVISNIILGFTMGFFISFMPNLEKKETLFK